MPALVYTLSPGAAPSRPLLLTMPHTGEIVPPEIACDFASPAIDALPMTDWHLHRLYGFLPALGVTTLAARYSRLVVDLNRPPRPVPLYPGRFETGLVATETFTGEAIYAVPPTAAAIDARREQFYAPYHARLQELIDSKRKVFGEVVLIDAHSVVSTANKLHGPLDAEIYLGDRDGQTCPAWLSDSVERLFTAQGRAVRRNEPYKGGYTTAHYGEQDGVHALQIEMCQRVYMNETDPAGGPKHHRFAETSVRLQTLFRDLLREIEARV